MKVLLKSLPKEEQSKVKKEKIQHFEKIQFYTVMFSMLMNIVSIMSDVVFGIHSHQFLVGVVSRTIPLIFFFIYCTVYKMSKEQEVKIAMAYIFCFIITISNIAVIHANKALEPGVSCAACIMNLMYFMIAISSPKKIGIIGHFIFLLTSLFLIPVMPVTAIRVYIIQIPLTVFLILLEYGMDNIFVENYLLRKELKELVVYDALTKCYNRNILKSLCFEDTDFLKKRQCGLILLDIDNFKMINDRYGHNKGDDCLKQMVSIIRKNMMPEDTLIRWGGEEFLIIVDNYFLMFDIAENIRNTIEKETRFTVSGGTTVYNGGPLSSNVNNADMALYSSKETGKNKITDFLQITPMRRKGDRTNNG